VVEGKVVEDEVAFEVGGCEAEPDEKGVEEVGAMAVTVPFWRGVGKVLDVVNVMGLEVASPAQAISTPIIKIPDHISIRLPSILDIANLSFT
jgi:hypothetical protein